MFHIEVRGPVVELWIPTVGRIGISSSVLGRERVANIVHRLCERVVDVCLETAREAFLEGGLPRMIIRVATVGTEADLL